MHLWPGYGFIFILLNFALTPIEAYEYCKGRMEEDLCKQNRHIVCYPEQVSQDGDLLAHYPMTAKLKRTLLELHNKRRDKIASGEEISVIAPAGNLAKFPKAVRIRELIWDNELAYMAHVHAARCHLEHDQCRSSKRFKYVGQNLAMFASSTNQSAMKMLETMVENWYTEKDLVADPTAAANEYGDPQTDGAGHLTVMIDDEVSRVGCAMAYCTECTPKKYKHCYFLTCDYDSSNLIGTPVYKVGTESASECDHWKTGRSSIYSHLCANTGEIFNGPTK